jgi:hypothetical protein
LAEELKIDFMKGDVSGARQAAEALKTAAGSGGQDEPMMLSFFGLEAVVSGRLREAEDILDKLERLRLKTYVEPLAVAELCAALHDRDKLHLWFHRGYEERSSWFVYSGLRKEVFGEDPEIAAMLASAIR